MKKSWVGWWMIMDSKIIRIDRNVAYIPLCISTGCSIDTGRRVTLSSQWLSTFNSWTNGWVLEIWSERQAQVPTYNWQIPQVFEGKETA